jgi:hypothetical protein
LGESLASGVAVALELFPQGVGGVEVGDPAGKALQVADVVAMQRLDFLLEIYDFPLQLVLQPMHFVERLMEAFLAAFARQGTRKDVRHQT